jgi:two-component system OmpR family sensor kinase
MRLRRPRRAKLRTRVLLGVLGVTLIALIAFDVAAVTALRGYLFSRTDQQLRQVLSLYRVLPVNHQVRSSRAPNRFVPPPREVRGQPLKRIIGPQAILPGALGQFDVVTVNHSRPLLSIMGGPRLLPQKLPNLAELAESDTAVTLTGQDGTTQIRLMAVSFPGYGLVYATTSLSGLQHTVGQLELILIIGSAAAGVIAAGGVAWVMRRGLRPVEVMAGEADKINAGDLTDRVSQPDPRTEIGRLGAALNGMLARIQDFVAEPGRNEIPVIHSISYSGPATKPSSNIVKCQRTSTRAGTRWSGRHGPPGGGLRRGALMPGAGPPPPPAGGLRMQMIVVLRSA